MLSAASDDCIRVVVATKMDLVNPEQREITVEEGKRLAQEMNEHLDLSRAPFEPYFETSSKDGRGVKDVFEYIFQHCLPLSDEQRKKQGQVRCDTVDLMDDSGVHRSGKTKCACWCCGWGRMEGSFCMCSSFDCHSAGPPCIMLGAWLIYWWDEMSAVEVKAFVRSFFSIQNAEKIITEHFSYKY